MDRSAGQRAGTCEAPRRAALSALASPLLAVLLAFGCQEPGRGPVSPGADRSAADGARVARFDAGPSAEASGHGAPFASDAAAQSASSRAPEGSAPEPAVPVDPLPAWALFRRYPALGPRIPVLPLARLPTPIERAESLELALGLDALYVKRDDRASDLYGGNKVRKLEPELARALALGRRTVVTFGGVGSNHALATALFARRAGLSAVLMLLPEPPSAHVRHNLLAEAAAGASMRLTTPSAIDTLVAAAERGETDPAGPYVIAPGGSSLLGNVGFVNAGFELASQVAAGELPEPDVLFVAMGTGGSAVGLAVGLRAAGLRTRVRGVRVSSDKYVSDLRARAMAKAVVEWLRSRDPSFPAVELRPDDLVILHRHVGRGYALPTAAGARAAALAKEKVGLELDATYTAKTVAALAAEAATLRGQVVLYWHTYDGREIEHGALTPSALPRELQGYAAVGR